MVNTRTTVRVRSQEMQGDPWENPVAATDCPVRSWRNGEGESLTSRADFQLGCKVVYSCSRVGCTALQAGALFWDGTVGECQQDAIDDATAGNQDEDK